MTIHLTKKSIGLALITVLLMVSTGAFFTKPLLQSSLLMREIYNFGHTPLFIIIAFSTCYIASNYIRRKKLMLSSVFLACLVYGGLVEILQQYVGREASWLDFIFDTIGTVIGILLYAAFYLYNKKRLLLIALSVILLALALTKPLSFFYSINKTNKNFPLLFDGEHIFSKRSISAINATTTIKKSAKEWKSNPSNILSIHFLRHQSSGVSLIQTQQDWSTYSYFMMDVYNPNHYAINIVLRIHDQQHNNQYHDRFNHTYTIHPGYSKIQLLVDYIEKQPAHRRINLHKVAGVILFIPASSNEHTLYIDNIYLH